MRVEWIAVDVAMIAIAIATVAVCPNPVMRLIWGCNGVLFGGLLALEIQGVFG